MKTSDVNKIRFGSSTVFFLGVLIFGIIFLALGIKLNLQKIPEYYVETEAEITRIDEILMPGTYNDSLPTAGDYEHHVYIKYSYKGKSYKEIEYGKYDSSMEEGDIVLLYLNPDNPNEFICDPKGNFMFIIVGFIVVLVGLGGVGYNIYKRKREE